MTGRRADDGQTARTTRSSGTRPVQLSLSGAERGCQVFAYLRLNSGPFRPIDEDLSIGWR
jgi:hypothetical protein